MKIIIILLILILLIFIPTSSQAQVIEPSKGLAMAYPEHQEDLLRLGENMWWYIWGSGNYDDPNYVPMSWCGENPNLSPEYNGYVMIFNEPDRSDQCNMLPEEAATIYRNMVLEYPQAKWVVGNTFGTRWLLDFHVACSDCKVAAWGVHHYSADLVYEDYLWGLIEELHNKLLGDYWITEFACPINSPTQLQCNDQMVKHFEENNWVKRWAYFTNRGTGQESWWPIGWNVQLFNFYTGEPTIIGNWYINGLQKMYFPIIISKTAI